eukprot:TRINITY_DN2435_c0_g1_i2.p1 TRINITY_DN2435_c0_g1~~TRINITY_DN2435_c0_g1_i2.p1  ORF type:complete len:496 (+),score=97.05 TRINITY_DN2435_c0_g1_i2:253-1740(+)
MGQVCCSPHEVASPPPVQQVSTPVLRMQHSRGSQAESVVILNADKPLAEWVDQLLDCDDLDAACANHSALLVHLLGQSANLLQVFRSVALGITRQQAVNLTQAMSTTMAREAISHAGPEAVARCLLRGLEIGPPLASVQCDVLLALLGEVVRAAGGNCLIVAKACQPNMEMWLNHLGNPNMAEALLRLATDSLECFWEWGLRCDLLGHLVSAAQDEESSGGPLRVLEYCLDWASHNVIDKQHLVALVELAEAAQIGQLLRIVEPASWFVERLKVVQIVVNMILSGEMLSTTSNAGVQLVSEAVLMMEPYSQLFSGRCANTTQLQLMHLLLPLIQLENSELDRELVRVQMIWIVLMQVGILKPSACLLRNAAARVILAVLTRADEDALQMQASLVPEGERSVFELLAGTAANHALGKMLGSELEKCAHRSVALLASLEREPSWWGYRSKVLEPGWLADQEVRAATQVAARSYCQDSVGSGFGKYSPSESFFFSGFD